MTRRIALAGTLAALVLGLAAEVVASDLLEITPDRLTGPERCGECHELELAAWKASAHQQGYFTMHREPAAKEIARALSIKRIKRDARCIACHYTPEPGAERVKAQFGVSCESCHGPARGWVDVHASYGGEESTRDSETAEHRRQRQADALAAGMRPPFAIERLARSCYSCHLIADRELVETTGHPVVSDGFELVAWTQGEVRHNYFYSQDKSNRPATTEHKRLLFVLGNALAVEYATRAASGDGSAFGRALDQIVAGARARLEAIAQRRPLPSIATILATLDEVAAGDLDRTAAADRIGAATRAFVASTDGSDLAALDDLLPPASSYRGEAQP